MHILKSLLFILVFSIAKPAYAEAEISTFGSVEEINASLFKSLDDRDASRVLIIMPLENFILKPIDPELNIKDDRFLSITSKLDSQIKLSKKDYLTELKLTEYKQELSDPKIIDFFHNIQKRNAPFLVVTRNFSGSFNNIPYLEAWTWGSLFERGLDLSKSPLGSKQIIFNEKNHKINGTYPTLYRGLLSCNFKDGFNSSQSLIAKLLAINLKWIPDVVYIIDPNEGYIRSMDGQLKIIKNDIQIKGFVYAPEEAMLDQVSPERFLKFWQGMIKKLNAVTRKELKSKENPYEQ
ncbi:MAG: hypothetical protein P8P83_03115 [Rickettsiaceae bacterium]|nr:hypothetical protein [Rickettsiaceae bacterium]